MDNSTSPASPQPEALSLWSMGDEELLARVSAASERNLWNDMLRKAEAAGDAEGARVARGALDRARP